MNNRVSFLSSHLTLAHDYWKYIATIGDTVIDATCGNGHDTYVLAQIVLNNTQGTVIAYDIQEAALINTEKKLRQSIPLPHYERIRFVQGCHSQFPTDCSLGSVKLIVYNLGYLPGGDKTKTTHLETTLNSLQRALGLIMPGGAITVTCYPGHAEGKKEEDAILTWVATLSLKEWNICYHQWPNRKQGPSLLLILKK